MPLTMEENRGGETKKEVNRARLDLNFYIAKFENTEAASPHLVSLYTSS